MAYIKKIKIGDTLYDLADGRIITLVDNGSTTAGTWVASTTAPAGNITEYKDGQLFYYKVTVAGGASTTTLNIDGLGAKTIYRAGTTKLTTQYPVGSYILLAYNSTNTCFRVVNDYDANSDNDKKTSSGNTDSKIYLVGATTRSTSGQTTYSHDTVYVDTNGRVNSRMNDGDTVATVVTTADATETVIKSINGGSGSFTPTTKYLHKSTTNVAPNGHTHTVTVSGTTEANSGNAVAAVTGVGANGTAAVLTGVKASSTDTFLKDVTEGSGSLVAYDASTNGTAKTTNGNRIPFITSLSKSGYTPAGSVSLTPGTAPSMNFNTEKNTDTPYISALTNGSYTPAGSVTLTNGTAPSLGNATTKYLSAGFSGTKTNALVTSATTKYAHFSAGALPTLSTTTKTLSNITKWSAGTVPSLTVTSKSPSKISSWSAGTMFNASVSGTTLTLTAGTAPSLSYDPEPVGSASGWSAGTAPSLTYTTDNAVSSVSQWYQGTLPSLTYNDTASGGQAIITGVTKGDYTPAGSISLTANTATATGRIKYVEAQGSFTPGDTPPKSASFTGTAANVVTGGTTKYMKFTAGTTPKDSASFAGTNSTAVVTGGTTYYLAHTHIPTTEGTTGTAVTAVAANGTATALTGVKATSTANVAPSGHTHDFSADATTVANNGTAVAAITGLTANTTAASGDITYLESATHTHTGASVSETVNVYKQ